MSRKAGAVGLVLAFAATLGCSHSCFQSGCEEGHPPEIGLPPHLESNPAASILPLDDNAPAPTTVLDPEREVRPLSLAEATAMSLEHGTVGSPALNGTTSDSLVSFQGGGVSSPENPIRVLALEPAILGTNIDASLAKFDALWNASMTWQRTDQPVGGNFLTDFQNGDRATFTTGLLKPLPTGGVAGITFNTQYTLLNSPPAGITNPTYRPSLQFQFEQPLLQGFGVEINQLRTTHPGSVLTPFTTGGRVEGILITRLRFDEQRAEFERQVQLLLVNVEVAYWNLYATYWNLYTREQALGLALEAWRLNKQRFEGGITSNVDLAQSRGQYELFRGQRLDALAQVLESEHQLRGLLGLPVEDGSRLVPVDAPTLASYQPDWHEALSEALALRPELVLARQDLKFRQLDLIDQENLLLPDLRFTSTYDINGIGTHLDGGSGDPNNAFHSLATDQFKEWSLGLRLAVPIGLRDANAATRAARLRLAESYLVLRDQENKTRRLLAQQYRQLVSSYQQIQAQRSQREAFAEQLQGRFRDYVAGQGTLDVLLEAQRFWADALRNEYAAVVEYNNTLARFEFAKGTMLHHDCVVIAEGPLPHCDQIRAVEHERQRSQAIVLRERAQPVAYSPLSNQRGAGVGLPQLSASTAASLPSLFANQSPLPQGSGPLPPVPSEAPPILEVAAKQGPAVLPPGSLTAPAVMPGGGAQKPISVRADAKGEGDQKTGPPSSGERNASFATPGAQPLEGQAPSAPRPQNCKLSPYGW